MATIPFPVGRDKENTRNKPVTRELPLPQSSDVSHGEPMTKAEREEMASLKEEVHQLKLRERVQPQPTKWFMTAIASITILGAAGAFVGNSGMWIGNRNRDAEQIKEMKDQIEYLKTWNEKLRNNMSAYGWLIDHDGNVSRVEQSQRRR